MTDFLRVLAGELRADLASLFDGEACLRAILAVPGLVAAPPEAALHKLARSPYRPLTAADAHAWLRTYLDMFGQELDALPQTATWEQRLVDMRRNLLEDAWQIRFHGAGPVFERLITRGDATVLGAGPWTLAGAERAPENSLLPVLRGEAHLRARQHFDGLWETSEDIGRHVAQLIAESWAGGTVHPADLYYKVVLEYFEDMLTEPADEDDNPLLQVMADFQIRAYQTAKGMLRRYGGVLLSDVVGLGKT